MWESLVDKTCNFPEQEKNKTLIIQQKQYVILYCKKEQNEYIKNINTQ